MNYTDIVKKLIGNIKTVADDAIDVDRFENLKVMTALVEDLIREIQIVSDEKNSPYSSAKKAGDYAYKFLKELSENYPQTF